MKRPAVRCRCGHQVLAKEVLRTDLYERPSGREYVYVKYRCKRCKRMGETFVAEHRWDWRIFEAPQSELSESETELFSSQSPISSEDLLDFHRLLDTIGTTRDLAQEERAGESVAKAVDSPVDNNEGDARDGEAKPDAPAKTPRVELKPDAKKEPKKDSGQTTHPEDGNAR